MRCGRHTFIGFDKNIANIIRGDMDSIRNASDAEDALLQAVEGGDSKWVSSWESYLCRSRKHALTSIQPGSTGFLYFLNFHALLADYGTHSRVGDHELDSDCSAAGHGRNVEGLIVDATHDESNGLQKNKQRRNGSPSTGLTFETASSGPLTFNILSGFPGILSDTITRAPLFSLISLTCAPPLPMIMEASWVTIKQRM